MDSASNRPLMEPRSGSWRRSLATAVRDVDELCLRLQLPDDFRTSARSAVDLFPLLAPLSYLARMKVGDPDDPLLRQVLPIDAETKSVAGFTTDPVAEINSQATPGLIRKYAGRALLVVTGACAIHCRYCFRRHFPYEQAPRGLSAWEPVFADLQADPTIHEVLLSGGDPLTMTDAWLEEFVDRLSAIEHLRRLRIHTRLPIVLPDRVDEDLLDWLTKSRLTPIVVVHANHANELVGDAVVSLRRLIDAGITVLNQAVLLRGVNDTLVSQVELHERLIDLGVVPYYLHQLDRVAGAAHFEVPISAGRQLMHDLADRLPGYAIPRYVQEIPGAAGKTNLLSIP